LKTVDKRVHVIQKLQTQTDVKGRNNSTNVKYI